MTDRYLALNFSGNDTASRALSLQNLSNVGIPGLWLFRVDGMSIESGGMYAIIRNIHGMIMSSAKYQSVQITDY